MDTENALSLSDAFIQKCELLNNMEQITNLQYRMILEYTEQVEKIRHASLRKATFRECLKSIPDIRRVSIGISMQDDSTLHINRTFIQQKLLYSHIQNSLFIMPRNDIVFHYDNFPK